MTPHRGFVYYVVVTVTCSILAGYRRVVALNVDKHLQMQLVGVSVTLENKISTVHLPIAEKKHLQ